MAVQNNAQRNENVDLIYGSEAPLEMKRNPYLVAFEEQQSRKQYGSKQSRYQGYVRQDGAEPRRSVRRLENIQRPENVRGTQNARGTEYTPRTEYTRRVESASTAQNGRSRIQPEIPGGNRNHAAGYERDRASRQQAARRAAQVRRRKRLVLQRALISVWIVCIFMLAVTFLFKNSRVFASGNGRENNSQTAGKGEDSIQYSGTMIQGIHAEDYAKHPAWEENFLTPNEYSRPGDALERVDNIFVHYTANPGTSAAQNRSYFEWLKDTHETSASAHFIIGYEGEIIQCIPLDEIAYAVQSRNFDSISIECCYLKEDGSFTQETYDSLISLLAWLRDAYHLETEDILRHYDCGGKKCPLYYTDNPDEWEELKKDVDKL